MRVNDGGRPRAAPDWDGDEPEELSSNAAFNEAWDVDVAAQRCKRERRRVALVEVVPEPSGPHQAVGVQVDGGVPTVKLTRPGGTVHSRKNHTANAGESLPRPPIPRSGGILPEGAKKP